MGRPYLASITYDPKGGGVAAVSRLLRQVMRDRWGQGCRLVTLLADAGASDTLHASAVSRLRFGTRLAQAQMTADCAWVFYSHLGPSRVQAFIPPAWRRPYGVFVHGIEAWRPLTATQRQILRRAALRVANSQLTAQRVGEANPGLGPISVCPLALPDGFDRSGPASPADLPARIGSRAVVLVARMMAAERYKGHDELLAAWPEVRARVSDAQLVFVGGGDDARRLEARAASLGLREAVVFTGFVSDRALHAIYRHAAALAMPSAGDGFGLVYLEAMAHRLPCVGSIHDAASEIIEDEVTGFLVDQADRRGLAARLIALLTNEARRREMGEAGHRRWREQFTYEQFARRMVSLLETHLDSTIEHRQAS
jgi:phosphatidylinositol alpha-1,6-mannosyltransferase